MKAEEIIEFWFEELTPKQWWVKDNALDDDITQRFKSIHDKAIAGELSLWRNNAIGSLAEIIVLDQFSRNIYRDTALSFAYDTVALVLAQEAIKKRYHLSLSLIQKSFLYMPFMHSESLAIHDEALVLFSGGGMESNLKFEIEHRDIIAKFGRYPHRNIILGRPSTSDEQDFLTTHTGF